jgi:DNA-directed RNA polymerase subunit RPC12/RpoP
MQNSVLDVRVAMANHRCSECGVFWSVEAYALGRCPSCAARLVDQARKRELRAVRAVASLRGRLSRVQRLLKQE